MFTCAIYFLYSDVSSVLYTIHPFLDDLSTENITDFFLTLVLNPYLGGVSNFVLIVLFNFTNEKRAGKS